MSVIPPGADAPRPLPAALADALRDELADAPIVARLQGIDGPRPLPADLQARLEAALGASGGAIPPRFARRLLHEMTGRSVPVPLAVAAVVLFVVGLVSVGLVGAGPTPAGSPHSSADGEITVGPSTAPGDDGVGGAASADAIDGATAATTAPTAGSAAASVPPSDGSPSGTAGAARSSPAGGQAAAVGGSEARRAGPVRIGLVGAGTGSDVEAGLRGFVAKTNEAGGVGGRRIEVVATGPSSPAADVLAVVNATDVPVARASGPPPPWVMAPLLEGLHVEEAALRGPVRSFSSTLERQAHVAARGAFPTVAPGSRATIYVGTESPWSDRVPAAFERVLRDRQVVTVRMPFDPAAPAFAASDAAFISLPAAQVPAFLTAADDAGNRPRFGTWGVASLLDERFVEPARRHGSVALASPYTVEGDEGDRLRMALARPLTAGTVHGWVTAKALVTAIGRSQPRTPAEMDAALEALIGWESGFFPPYEVRPGTTARTPEAVVLRVTATGFTSAGEFQRDPT